jgi:hypothetical protein
MRTGPPDGSTEVAQCGPDRRPRSARAGTDCDRAPLLLVVDAHTVVDRAGNRAVDEVGVHRDRVQSNENHRRGALGGWTEIPQSVEPAVYGDAPQTVLRPEPVDRPRLTVVPGGTTAPLRSAAGIVWYASATRSTIRGHPTWSRVAWLMSGIGVSPSADSGTMGSAMSAPTTALRAIGIRPCRHGSRSPRRSRPHTEPAAD